MPRTMVYEQDVDGEKHLTGWFNPDSAEEFEESTHWDGNNMVSDVATGFGHHQAVYRTSGGRWVLHFWSQWSGVQPSYEYIDGEAAREWLLRCGHEDAVERYFGEVEEERGPGRPGIGDPVQVRLPVDLLATVDAWAAERDISRAEAIRRLVTAGLAR